MMIEDGNNAADAKPSQVRTLSNGLVIQELKMGAEDGKIAALGKKISIHYTGKLKENGVVFESNAGQAPFKFRLGKGEVIEGWDVGLEGMRVGEKRRLVIPPSMTSESDGQSAKITSNWLKFIDCSIQLSVAGYAFWGEYGEKMESGGNISCQSKTGFNCIITVLLNI